MPVTALRNGGAVPDHTVRERRAGGDDGPFPNAAEAGQSGASGHPGRFGNAPCSRPQKPTVQVQVIGGRAHVLPEDAVHPRIADAAQGRHLPVQIDDMKKAGRRNPGDDLRIHHLNAGKGQGARCPAKAADSPAPHLYGIEAGQVMQGHGDRMRALLVLRPERCQVQLVIYVAVEHQKRLGCEPGQGLAQTAARAQNFRLHLQLHAGQAGHSPFYLPGQMVGVDEHARKAGLTQALQMPKQQGPVQHRKKRLGADIGIGFEPGAEARGQKHGLHKNVVILTEKLTLARKLGTYRRDLFGLPG